MSIFDFFTREAGQERRRALEGLLTQFIPPEMRPQLGLLAEANPVVSMERAGQDAQQLFAPDQTIMDRIASLGRMSSNIAGTVAPAMVAGRAGVPVVNAVQDVLTGYSPMVQPFMADESGALRLFHGSPHDFDRFSMSKIGTGEGAQAYGHGLYFAENEGIARSYRDALSNSNPYTSGQYYSVDGSPVRFTWSGAQEDPKAMAAKMIDDLGGDKAAAIARARDVAASGDTTQNWAEIASAIEKIGTVERMKGVPGRMYEVQINADPNDFLDWDKPLSAQPKALEALRPVIGNVSNPGYGVKSAIDDASKYLGYADDPRRAEDLLRETGIPGIRYLDAGSRSFTPTTIKEGPNGVELYWGNDPRPVDIFPTRQAAEEAAKQFDTRSRNYVVFDENLIEIVRKYGIAGAAAMLGMSQADVAQAMQQQPQPQGLLAGPQ